MKYIDYLSLNRKEIIERLENSINQNKVQPVGDGYIDCIVMKDNLKQFVNDISSIGIIISDVSWWCYVDPNYKNSGCPHGMGGPISDYYVGWFSELQNELYEANKDKIDSILYSYDNEAVNKINQETMFGIENILKEPLKYTPSEFIEENKCVMPGLWLFVPDDWKRQ
jgi:hypothetical protein